MTIAWALVGIIGIIMVFNSMLFLSSQVAISLVLFASNGNRIKLITNHMRMYLKSNWQKVVIGITGLAMCLTSYVQIAIV